MSFESDDYAKWIRQMCEFGERFTEIDYTNILKDKGAKKSDLHNNIIANTDNVSVYSLRQQEKQLLDSLAELEKQTAEAVHRFGPKKPQQPTIPADNLNRSLNLKSLLIESLNQERQILDEAHKQKESHVAQLEESCSNLWQGINNTNAVLLELEKKMNNLKFQHLMEASSQRHQSRPTATDYPIEMLVSKPAVLCNNLHEPLFIDPLKALEKRQGAEEPKQASEIVQQMPIKVIEFEKGFVSVERDPHQLFATKAADKLPTQQVYIKPMKEETPLKTYVAPVTKTQESQTAKAQVITVEIEQQTTNIYNTNIETSASRTSLTEKSKSRDNLLLSIKSAQTSPKTSIQQIPQTFSVIRGPTDFLRLPWEQDLARHLFLKTLMSLSVIQAEDLFDISAPEHFGLLQALVKFREANSSVLSSILQIEKCFSLTLTVAQAKENIQSFVETGQFLETFTLGDAGTLILCFISTCAEGLVPQNFVAERLDINAFNLIEDDLTAELRGPKLKLWNCILAHFAKLIGFSMVVHQKMSQQRSSFQNKELTQGLIVVSDIALLLCDLSLPLQLRAFFEAQKAQMLLAKMQLVRNQKLPNGELKEILLEDSNSLFISCIDNLPVSAHDAFSVGSNILYLFKCDMDKSSSAKQLLRLFRKVAINEILRSFSPQYESTSKPFAQEDTLGSSIMSLFLSGVAQTAVVHVAKKLLAAIEIEQTSLKGLSQGSDSLAKQLFVIVSNYLDAETLPAFALECLKYFYEWCKLKQRDAAAPAVLSMFAIGIIANGLSRLSTEDVEASCFTSLDAFKAAQCLKAISASFKAVINKKDTNPAVDSIQRKLVKILDKVEIGSDFLLCLYPKGNDTEAVLPDEITMRSIQSFILRNEPAVSAKLLLIVQSYNKQLFEISEGDSEPMSKRLKGNFTSSKRAYSFQFFKKLVESRSLKVRLSQSCLSLTTV